MSTVYHAIHWNRQKYFYDAVILYLVVLAIVTFVATSRILYPAMTAETLILRGTAFLSLFLIHLILAIGPLARLNTRFIPLLYNRRHLGVSLFFLSALHGALALIQFHGFGDVFPLVSVFTSYAFEFKAALGNPINLTNIPFEPFGVAAFLILYLLAITSHDFWLRLLGAPRWKMLHTLSYVAYALIILHIAFGFLQSEIHMLYPLFLTGSTVVLFGLHLAAYLKGKGAFAASPARADADGYFPAGRADRLVPGRGSIIKIGKRRFALFLHEGRIFALSNVCRHQGGPIGEGNIVDGCVTCPWHGWQYSPEDGTSPPPFHEKIPTYPVAIRDGVIYVKPVARVCGDGEAGATDLSLSIAPPPETDFYVGHTGKLSPGRQSFLIGVATTLLVACPLFMAGMAAFQSIPDPGHYAVGESIPLEGVLYTSPVPTLYVAVKTSDGGSVSGYHFPLCGQGKFGIPESWAGYEGMRVSLTGTVVYRREVMMYEVDSAQEPTVLGPPAQGETRPPTEVVGTVRLVGELVDTKCYLGAMRPGTGKVHRACAIRCLSGGVPPGILVRSRDGDTVVFLAGEGTEPLKYDVSWAGRFVDAHGTLYRQQGFSVIHVNDLKLYDGDSE